MNFINIPTSTYDLSVMILLVPFLVLYEGLQELIVTKLTSMTNYSTATVLGGRDESHENTLNANGELPLKTRMKAKDLVDASGNVVAEILVQVPAKTKMSIAGLQFFIFHALMNTIFPWYVFTIVAAKTILGFILIPYFREKWNWITLKLNYYRSANFIIDQLNKLPLATPIKKTYSSLTTYPLIILGPFVLAIFWSFKKLYLNRKNQNIPHGPKDSRGQAALNLGVMVLAFIGYSDFGLWKKFQDWIKFSDYATKVFGDAAADRTCINYNPKKFNIRCVGTAKGLHACITCAADKITHEPQISAAITRKLDARSIIDDPAPYFYELVIHLFLYDRDIPNWYLSLRPELQNQMFKSHYLVVWEKTRVKVPVEQRITHEKIVSGDYSFERNETLGKWVIIAKRNTVFSDASKEKEFESDSDSDSLYGFTTLDSQYARYHDKKIQAYDPLPDGTNMETKHSTTSNQPHAGNDEKEPAVPMFDHSSYLNGQITVTSECVRCGVKVSYPVDGFGHCAHCGLRAPPKSIKVPLFHAEAFEITDKESSFSLKEHFPFLAILPYRFIKPIIFLTAMCLVLYGSYYYYRKRKTDQVNSELQKQVISQIAEKVVQEDEKFATIPPVLQNLVVTEDEPEGQKGGVSRHRTTQRHKTRHEKRMPNQRPTEDSSDVTLGTRQHMTQFQTLKQNKKHNFITYDIDRLDHVLENKGVLFFDQDDKMHIAKTMDEFEMYVNRGYQFQPDEAFKAGSLDVSQMSKEEDDTVKMNPFSLAASHRPLTVGEYRFISEMLQSGGVLPDAAFRRHLTAIDGTHHYKYDEKEKMYVWRASTNSNIEESQNILKNDIIREQQIQPIQGLPSLTVRQQEYDRNKQLVQDLNLVQANKILEETRQKQLQTLVIAQPESNISTVESDDCPYKERCNIKNCVRKHPSTNQPEAMCGYVDIPHYPDDLRTDFVYPIIKTSNPNKKHGTCYLTPLGFISLKHVFKDELLSEFKLKVGDQLHEIIELTKFPTQKGYNNQELAQDFQDSIVFKIKDHTQVCQKLNSTRTSLPRAGLKVMVVTAGFNGNIRTEFSELREDPSTGMYLIKTNNDYGDSGSAVVDVIKKTTIGTYWGTKAKIDNYVIPHELSFVAAMNGNQKFQLTKNSRPSL